MWNGLFVNGTSSDTVILGDDIIKADLLYRWPLKYYKNVCLPAILSIPILLTVGKPNIYPNLRLLTEKLVNPECARALFISHMCDARPQSGVIL